MPTVKLNGRTYNQGDVIILNGNAPAAVGAPKGLRVQLYSVNSEENQIGLYSVDAKVESWNNLHGEVHDFRGWFVSARDLAKIVDQSEIRYEINKSMVYRGRELKGMPCKLIASLEGNLLFVELDEHVDGCSADGLGKTGHCIALSSGSVKVVKKSDKKKQTK